MKQIKDETVSGVAAHLQEFRDRLQRGVDHGVRVNEPREGVKSKLAENASIIKELDALIAELENLDPVKTEQEILDELRKTASEFNRIGEAIVPYYGDRPDYGFCNKCAHNRKRFAPECRSCKHINGDNPDDNWRPEDGEA